MRTLPLGIVSVVLLLLLGGLWWLIDSDGSRNTHASGAIDGMQPLEVGGGELADARPEIDRVDERDTASKRTELDSVGELTPEDQEAVALERAIVFGRVVTEAGTPVPGTTVYASRHQSWVSFPLDAEVPESARFWRQVESTVTDEEGRFEFEELEIGRTILSIRSQEHRPRNLDDVRVPESRRLDVGDVIVTPGAVVTGKVMDSRGRGVANARLLRSLSKPTREITVSIPGRGIPLGATSNDGTFRLANVDEGSFLLLVDSPGHLPHEEEVEATEGGVGADEVTISLEEGYSISGRVEGVAPEKVASLRVTARISRKDASGPEIDRLSPIANRPRDAMCDASGAFELTGLATGHRYRLTVYEPGAEEGDFRRFPELEPAYAYAGDKNVVVKLYMESTLTFFMVDKANRGPVVEAVIEAGFGDRQTLEDGDDTRTLHPQGRVDFPGLRRTGDVKMASVKIRAHGYDDLIKENIPLEEGGALDLGELELTPTRVVNVTVYDEKTQSPIADARAFIARAENMKTLDDWVRGGAETESWGDSEVHIGSTDDEGHASVSGFPGEMCALRVAATDYVPSEAVEFVLPRDADHDVSVTLTRGGTVLVTVADDSGKPVAGVSVRHQELGKIKPGDEEWGMVDESSKSDDLGLVVFKNLAVGKHVFKVHEGGAWFRMEPDSQIQTPPWTEVSLAEGDEKEVELETSARSEVFGVVTEAGEPLESANLRLRPANDRSNNVNFGWRGFGNDPNSATTDSDGSYRFANVESGDYRLVVSHSKRLMIEEYEITIGTEPFEKNIELSVASIEGRVADENGNGVEGVTVTVRDANGGSRRIGGDGQLVVREDEEGDMDFDVGFDDQKNYETDRDGRYVLRGVRPNVELRVAATDSYITTGSRSETPMGESEIRRDVDFSVVRAGILRIKAAFEGNQRHRVSAEFLGEGEHKGERKSVSFRRWSRTQRMRSMRPGKWKLVFARRVSDEWTELETREVTVVAEQTTELGFQAP